MRLNCGLNLALGQLEPHHPARLTAADAGSLHRPGEAVSFEQTRGADVTRYDVDPSVAGIGWVALDDLRTRALGVSHGAFQEVVHEALTPVTGTYHEADDRPGVAVIDERDGPRVHQAAVGGAGATEHQPAGSPSTYASTPGPGAREHSACMYAMRPSASKLDLR